MITDEVEPVGGEICPAEPPPGHPRVLLLGPGSVIHTLRWANGLSDRGLQVVCASQHPFITQGWAAQVVRVRLPHTGPLGYFLNAAHVRRLFEQQSCALLNAHYATGYGVLATLSGVRPRLISLWGSDIFDFPSRSLLHRAFVRKVLKSADGVASTSQAMANQARTVMPRGWRGDIAITPFGVDTSLFAPDRAAQAPRDLPNKSTTVVIGTVKTLEPQYGVDLLIRAFATLVNDESFGFPLRLRLVGGGKQRRSLESLAKRLNVLDRIEFVGPVPHAEVPRWLATMDIYVAASRRESFGVAVLEASAAGLPVVVTRVGGLPEVVREGETGLIVNGEDVAGLAAALRKLVTDPALRSSMGSRGREHVESSFEWESCIQGMIETYHRTICRNRRTFEATHL